MVNGGKYSILLKVIFSQCNTKGGNKEYVLCNSMLFAEFLYTLYGNFCCFPAVKLSCGNCSAFIRIEADASSCVFKYRSVIAFCVFINISGKSIPVVQSKIIGGIGLRFQLLTAVGPVNVIHNNGKGGTVSNNMMKVKEQIITFTGSVDFKPEKLLIKQHVRTDQCFFIHSVYDLCFVYKIIIPFLKHIAIIVHEKLCFQIRMGFHCTVNGCCKFIQIYLFIKFQQIRDIVDG